MNESVIKSRGPINETYLNRIKETINKALNEHPRTIAIRADLRLPDFHDGDNPAYFVRSDHEVISRFFASFKAQLSHDQKKRRQSGVRVHHNTLRYVWVRENNQEHKKHFHILIFLNKDTYRFIGEYESSKNAIANMIRKAWTSALGLKPGDSNHLVHFPENPFYILNKNNTNNFTSTYDSLHYRASYLAKIETKDYSDGFRCFGCSHR